MPDQTLLGEPLEAALGRHEVSQAVTTAGKNTVRLVRISRSAAIVLTEDRPDLEIIINGAEGGDLPPVVAKGIIGEIIDAGIAIYEGVLKLKSGGGGQNCTTTTRQTATFDKNGNMTGFKNETTTSCTPA